MTNNKKYIITFQFVLYGDTMCGYTGTDREARTAIGINAKGDDYCDNTHAELVEAGALGFADRPDQKTIDGAMAEVRKIYPDKDPQYSGVFLDPKQQPPTYWGSMKHAKEYF